MDITEKIAKAKATYLEVANGDPKKARSASDALKKLQAEQSAALSKGAKPCQECGAPAFCMKKQDVVAGGVVVASLYEVGCSAGNHGRARGGSPEAAVKAWNAGELVG